VLEEVVLGVEETLSLSGSGVKLDPIPACTVSSALNISSCYTSYRLAFRQRNPPHINPSIDKPLHNRIAGLLSRREDIRDLLGAPVLAEVRAGRITDVVDEALGVLEVALLQANADRQDLGASGTRVLLPDALWALIALLVEDVVGGRDG